MVRIHARQPSSTRADVQAIIGVQKLDTEILLSGFTVLLGQGFGDTRITPHIFALLI